MWSSQFASFKSNGKGALVSLLVDRVVLNAAFCGHRACR